MRATKRKRATRALGGAGPLRGALEDFARVGPARSCRDFGRLRQRVGGLTLRACKRRFRLRFRSMHATKKKRAVRAQGGGWPLTARRRTLHAPSQPIPRAISATWAGSGRSSRSLLGTAACSRACGGARVARRLRARRGIVAVPPHRDRSAATAGRAAASRRAGPAREAPSATRLRGCARRARSAGIRLATRMHEVNDPLVSKPMESMSAPEVPRSCAHLAGLARRARVRRPARGES